MEQAGSPRGPPASARQPIGKAQAARGLDETDLRILAELQRNGRVKFQQLAQLVALSTRPCVERVRRLERARIVVGYTTRVDLRRLLDLVTVIAQIRIKQGCGFRAQFEQRIHSCPEVLECFEASGSFDYIIKVVCPDLEVYRRLTQSWINDPSLQVERIEGHVVLRAAKACAGVYPVSIAVRHATECAPPD